MRYKLMYECTSSLKMHTSVKALSRKRHCDGIEKTWQRKCGAHQRQQTEEFGRPSGRAGARYRQRRDVAEAMASFAAKTGMPLRGATTSVINTEFEPCPPSNRRRNRVDTPPPRHAVAFAQSAGFNALDMSVED
jgi:hypothetical protein